MPKQAVRMGRSRGGPNGASPDMALDIVSYGRRGLGSALRFGAGEGHGEGIQPRRISRQDKLPIETDEGLSRPG